MAGAQSQNDANEAILRAMMADIGDGRVEELHLEDGEHTRNRVPVTDTRRSVRPRRPQQVNNVWRIAQESGVFDDEDAAQVKGLDDLGGGRIYDRVRDQTLEILKKTHAPRPTPRQSLGGPHKHPSRDSSDPPSKRKKGHGGKAVPVSAPATPGPTQSLPQPRKPANAHPSTVAHFAMAALRRTRPAPDPFDAARHRLPNPEPEHLLKIAVGVNFGRGITIVHFYLSAPSSSADGLFRFYNTADGILMTERKLSDLVDFIPYAVNEGMLRFRMASYRLEFRNRAEMERFDVALKTLFSTKVPGKTDQQIAATPKNVPATIPPQEILSNSEALRNPSSQSKHCLHGTVVARSPEPQLKLKISASSLVPPTAASKELSPKEEEALKRGLQQSQASSSMIPVVRLPSPVQPPATHGSGDETGSSQICTENVTECASSRDQLLFEFASESSDRHPSYSQVTHRELEKIFEAAFQGVQGGGPQVRAAVREAIQHYYKIIKNPEERRRIQYSREELFSYRDHAVPPPPYLSELRFLPRPRWMEEERDSLSIESAQVPKFTGVADDMAWVLDDSPRRADQQLSSSQPDNEPSKEETPAKKPKNDMKEAVKAGLMKSIWAPATSTYVMELAELDMGLDTGTPQLAQTDGANSAFWWTPASPLQGSPATSAMLPSTPAESVMSGSRITDTDQKSGAAQPTPSKRLRMIERAATAVDAVERVSEGISRLTINDHSVVNLNGQSPAQQPTQGTPSIDRHFTINVVPVPASPLSPASVPRTLTGVTSLAPSTTGDVSTVTQMPVSRQTAQIRPKGLAASRHARP